MNENFPNLPGTQWLGYGLNMTTLSPIDIDAVNSSILQARRFIDLQEQTSQLLVNSTTYTVPNNVRVHDAPSVHSVNRVYESGDQAVMALQNDMSFASTFLAISLNASASNTVRRSFQATSQYALYSSISSQYSISFNDYCNHLNEANLKRSITTLPTPFSPSVDIINQYKSFFATFGSHIITGVTYGSRLQITASSSSKDFEIQSHFSLYVNAAFNGVISSGEFNASIKQRDNYQAFYAGMEKTIAIRGGDYELAISLTRNPTDLNVYHRWAATHRQHPDLVGVQTQEIWHLMQYSSDTEIINAANAVREAYQYIVTNVPPHITPVQFTIYSDWGTFGLISPEAVITEDPGTNQYYPGYVYIESKTAGWRDKTHSIVTLK